MGQGAKLCNALVKEKVDGASPVFPQSSQIVHHLVRIGNTELVIYAKPQSNKGDERKTKCAGNDRPAQFAILISFHSHHLAVSVGRSKESISFNIVFT